MCVVNGQDKLVDTKQLLGIRKELAEVRDKVNSLVDALDSARVADDHSLSTVASGELAVSPFTVNVIDSHSLSSLSILSLLSLFSFYSLSSLSLYSLSSLSPRSLFLGRSCSRKQHWLGKER